jgi:hypothetical protein
MWGSHAPVFDPIGNKTVSAGSVLTFTIKATDADGDALIYWASDLPQGAIFDHVTKTFTWTPAKNQIGVYTVTFKVRDATLITAETITITVGKLITVPTDANSIQKAINLAGTGDTIVVEQGRYRENIHFNGKNIILKSINSDDPDIAANTIIDGNGAGSVVTFGPSNPLFNSSLSGGGSVQLAAFFIAAVGDEIAGFTITGGNASQGGGIYIDSVCPTIEKNIITANNAVEGGGIYCKDGSAIIRFNKITGNKTAFGTGGAICGINSSATVANNLIADNAAYYGSGISWFKGKPTIVNNTIACNSSTLNSFTCGIAVDPGEPLSFIKNNIIAFNNNGAGIYGLSEIAPASFAYNNVFANSTGNYGGKLADQTGRNGNMSANPFFFDTPNKDFHLKSRAGRWDANGRSWLTDTVTSPCIDAGDPNDNFADELWPHGRRINMGAYGGTPQASMSESDTGSIADLNNDGIVDDVDMAIFTKKWLSTETLLHEDFNRDGIVDFKDFALFGMQYDEE